MPQPEPYDVVAHNIDSMDNAIHSDEVAQSYGFAGALVPGVELFAVATTPLVAAWGERWLSRGRIDLRFRRPVYDGERLRVVLDGTVLEVRGPDGEVRSTGSAREVDDERPAPLSPDDVPLPAGLPADPVVGPLGTVHEPVSAEDGRRYADGVDEPHALYREGGVAHPGLLLRLVNLLLIRNVALGPWVHTSSDCRLLGVARLPATFTVHGRVTDVHQRNGHDRVRYDAVVRADGEPVLQVDHTAIYRLAAPAED